MHPPPKKNATKNRQNRKPDESSLRSVGAGIERQGGGVRLCLFPLGGRKSTWRECSLKRWEQGHAAKPGFRSLVVSPWACHCLASMRRGWSQCVACQSLDIASPPCSWLLSLLPSCSYGGGSFSFSNLIQGVTRRFSTEFELQPVRSLGPWGSCPRGPPPVSGGSRHSAPTERQGVFIRQWGSMWSGLLHVQRKLGIQTS